MQIYCKLPIYCYTTAFFYSFFVLLLDKSMQFMNYQIRPIQPAEIPVLSDLLSKDGYKSVSLSVQKANYAIRMYQKAGFHILSQDAEEAIMRCPLK